MANLIRRRDDRDRDRSGEMARRGQYDWDPFRMLRDWDPFGMMTSFFRRDPVWDTGASPWTFAPSFDVQETDASYLFLADLPGVRDEDLDVSVTRNMLTVSGRRTAEEVQENERYHCTERAFGEFRRTFSLPESADADSVTAELKDGVLRVTLKKQPSAHARRIPLGDVSGRNPPSSKHQP